MAAWRCVDVSGEEENRMKENAILKGAKDEACVQLPPPMSKNWGERCVCFTVDNHVQKSHDFFKDPWKIIMS